MAVRSTLSHRSFLLTLAGVLACVPVARTVVVTAPSMQAAVDRSVSATCADMEEFLKTARIGPSKQLSVGVTAPSRARLTSGTMEHDASIQTTDESKATFEGARSSEVNFRDSWKYNVAGYELAKMLSLDMVPPYVERKVSGQAASLSWWVNDAMMERERFQRKITPPDVERWNREMYAVRIFHQLIYDTDPNLTNLLITKDWRIWMIDFTRAFRRMKALQNTKDLVMCDRTLLARLRLLTPELLQEKLGSWLVKPEIDGLLARRDLIVQFFDGEVARRGEAAVLYDLPRSSEPCGTGLAR
jgi:hypothetical protein